MDAKHTKGPWYASRLSEGVWIIKNETFDSYIALTHHREGVHADANASLIAAAPDLLEACKAALPMCKAHGANGFIAEMLDIAIAKAEGR